MRDDKDLTQRSNSSDEDEISRDEVVKREIQDRIKTQLVGQVLQNLGIQVPAVHE